MLLDLRLNLGLGLDLGVEDLKFLLKLSLNLFQAPS